MANIDRDTNKVTIVGSLADSDLYIILACLHHAVEQNEYQDIILDFSDCSAAFQSSMLGLCAQVLRYKERNVDFDLVLPNQPRLARLFKNANWAHILDPRNHGPSTFKGYTQVPAIQYRDPDTQHSAVRRILDVILGAVSDMSRGDFAAFEWSIYEIMDNVLTHSDSTIGGLVQVSTFQKTRKRIQFIVADAGAGIPRTLREGHPEIISDAQALDSAIREGVTRDKAVGQGNGLFGSYQICSHCNGHFEVDSGNGILRFKDHSLHVNTSKIPFAGTMVVAEMDFSDPKLLAEALQFQGKRHQPVDIIELNYELEEGNCLKFIMNEESRSFGSRPAGTPIRNKLKNIYEMGGHNKVYVDFRDVPLVSSSFADEVFGKLFLDLGPLAFMQAFEIVNAMPTVASLIDRAIGQRVKHSSS